ncbi:MAG: SdpI family protein [Caulobacter sp.]|nr:SdpI family protein [Caulobacter sp.]
MNLKPTRIETAAMAVIALQLAAAGFTATQGSTAPVPMHFNYQGVVDRWGDRTEAAWFILLLAGITVLLVGAISFSLRTNAPSEARRRGLSLAQGVCLAIMGLLTLLPLTLASPSFDPAMGGQLAGAVICVVLGLVGAVMGKVPPNALVGVRTPWSLNSRLAWDRSNRLAGRLFFWGGLLALPVMPFLSSHQAVSAVAFGALLIGAISVFESWRVWRADPDRRAV